MCPGNDRRQTGTAMAGTGEQARASAREKMIDTARKPSVHDQALIEAEIDGRVVRFRAVVVNLMPAALWLGLVRKDPSLEQLRPGDPIVLTFSRNGIGMVAESSFLTHLNSAESRLFAIEFPSDYRLIQRRSYLRTDAECPVEYLVTSQSDAGGAGMTGEGMTSNISAGGIQFIVNAPVAETVHELDSLEIRLAVGQGAVMAEAEVVRVEDCTDLGPDLRPLPPTTRPRRPRTLIAVRFAHISEAAQDRIIRHIFALQRLRRSGRRRTLPEAIPRRGRRRDGRDAWN
jgi:c-di-GMP-binding flagellar brake protein YcgR